MMRGPEDEYSSAERTKKDQFGDEERKRSKRETNIEAVSTDLYAHAACRFSSC